MLLRVTTSSKIKKNGCKTYIYKIWEIPLVRFLMQWKSIFMSSVDDVRTLSKWPFKETRHVSNALQ